MSAIRRSILRSLRGLRGRVRRRGPSSPFAIVALSIAGSLLVSTACNGSASNEAAGKTASKEATAKADSAGHAKAEGGDAKADTAGDAKVDTAGDAKVDTAGDAKADTAGDAKAEGGDAKVDTAGDAKGDTAGDAKADTADDAKAEGGEPTTGDAKADTAGDAKAEGGETPPAADPAALQTEIKNKKTTDARATAALAELEASGAKLRDVAKAANERGTKLYETPDRAKTFFEWAAAKDPKYPDPVFNLGKQTATEGDVEATRAHLIEVKARGGKKLLQQIDFDPMWEIVKDDPEVRKLLGG
jgi:hypothetical protein